MNKKIKAKRIKQIIDSFFEKTNTPKNIYQPVTESLIEISLRGVDSHGIRLIPHYVRAILIGRINKKPKFKLKKTSCTTMLMNADHTFGITAGKRGMSEAIKMAKDNGTGIVAIKNSSHFGAAAIYALQAAKNNMIGLSFTNVDSLVVPYGGKKPFLGTNPICFAAPVAGEDPFCLDMATTTISWNKLKMYKNQNKKLENNCAVDSNGIMTRDTHKAAALLPIAGYKGYGLGLMVEILCSLLTGMTFGPNIQSMYPLTKNKRYLGHFMMAIDIKKFQSVKLFKKRLKKISDLLRNTPPAKGFKQVMVPGDPEKLIYKKRVKQGIPLTQEIIEDYHNLAKELNLNINL